MSMNMNIIAIGHYRRVGKDTFANYLVEKVNRLNPHVRIAKMPWAWKLKQICHELYAWDGLREPEFYETEPGASFREVPLPTIGKSPRQIWIDFGTPAVRERVYGRTWLDYVLRSDLNRLAARHRRDGRCSAFGGIELEGVVGEPAHPHPLVVIRDANRFGVIRLDESPEFQGLVASQAEAPLELPPLVLRFDIGVKRAVHCTLHHDLIREAFTVAPLRVGQKGGGLDSGMGRLQHCMLEIFRSRVK